MISAPRYFQQPSWGLHIYTLIFISVCKENHKFRPISLIHSSFLLFCICPSSSFSDNKKLVFYYLNCIYILINSLCNQSPITAVLAMVRGISLLQCLTQEAAALLCPIDTLFTHLGLTLYAGLWPRWMCTLHSLNSIILCWVALPAEGSLLHPSLAPTHCAEMSLVRVPFLSQMSSNTLYWSFSLTDSLFSRLRHYICHFPKGMFSSGLLSSLPK